MDTNRHESRIKLKTFNFQFSIFNFFAARGWLSRSTSNYRGRSGRFKRFCALVAAAVGASRAPLYLALTLILLQLSAIAQTPDVSSSPLQWPLPTRENRPWTRWWWLGSAVDKTNLTRLLTEYRDAGIGGVEICPIYGAKGHEDRFIDFLSPKWMEMFAHTAAECKRLGLGLDLTTGTGWPFGGPNVTPEIA